MSLATETVWSGIKIQLSQRIPQVLFDQWFSRAEIVSWDGLSLELGVQNRFFKSRIETTYMATLADAVEAAVGHRVSVTVSVSPKLLAAFRKSQTEMLAEASKMEGEAPPPALLAKPEPKQIRGLALNPAFVFDSFVIGASNRLSHAVALRAVDNPGEFNCIYLCGQHGVGKTHLLQALCHETRRRRPDALVMYVTCERFVADFTSAHANGRLKEFRSAYRACDVLAFDELQALGVGNKAGTQAALLGIVDELAAKGKQVVFAGTQTPAELDGVDAKLRDRLTAGFVDRIALPDEATRCELVARKLAEHRLEIPETAVALMARELYGNVRKLEGAVRRLAALIEFEGMEPTTSCIRLALEVGVRGTGRTALTARDVIDAVAEEYGVAPEALTGRGRAHALRLARQLAMALCRRLVGLRYAELGETFGGRSHATVITALKNIPSELFSSGIEGRPLERILFRLGVSIKPEELSGSRQRGLF